MRALLFDLDGTLLDSAPDIIAFAKSTAAEHGQSLPAEEYMRSGISGGIALVFSRIFKLPVDDPFINKLRQRFLTEFIECDYSKTSLFPGIECLLLYLDKHQIPWGIITNKTRDLSERVISTLRPLQKTNLLICGDDLPLPKPDPYGLQKAARRTGHHPRHCWYLGDSRADMEAATAAGMKPMLAGWGYISSTDKPDQWGAEERFQTVEDFRQRVIEQIVP